MAKSIFSKRTRTLYHWMYPTASKQQIKDVVSNTWESMAGQEKNIYIAQVISANNTHTLVFDHHNLIIFLHTINLFTCKTCFHEVTEIYHFGEILSVLVQIRTFYLAARINIFWVDAIITFEHFYFLCKIL